MQTDRSSLESAGKSELFFFYNKIDCTEMYLRWCGYKVPEEGCRLLSIDLLLMELTMLIFVLHFLDFNFSYILFRYDMYFSKFFPVFI